MSPIETIAAAPLWTPPADLTGAARIAAVNDRFRTHYGTIGAASIPGKIVMTQGVAALGAIGQFALARAVRAYQRFNSGNDPHGEHDFGELAAKGLDDKVLWKIDVYADQACEWGAEDEDRGDPTRSYRLLTILLASEY
jgi:hypothetical protein